MLNTKTVIAWLLIGFFTTAGTMNSLAEESSSAKPIEEIVVTAQLREQAVSDIPFAIQALSGEKIEMQGLETGTDLIKIIPGATTTQANSSTNTTLSIRGVSSYVEMDPVIGYYIDDAPFGIPGFTYAPSPGLFDLERVEAIRSPQGTLYGQSAMGGVIKVYTKDPDLTAGFYGRVRVGASTVHDGDDGWNADLSMNIPLIEDKLAGSLTISQREVGGWLEVVDYQGGTEEANDIETFEARGKILWEPNDDLSIKFSIWHQDTDENFGNWVSSPAFGFDPSDRQLLSGGGLGGFFLEFDIYSLFVRKDMEFATLEYSATYADWELNFPIALGFAPGVGFVSNIFVNTDATTHEFRLLSNNEGPFNWVVGYHYREGEKDFNSRDSFVFGFPNPDQVSIIDTEAQAVFGEASYEFMDGFAELTLGLRWFEDDRDFFQTTTPPGGPTTVGFDQSETFDAVSERINVTLHPSENGMVYFNAASAFRSGVSNLGNSIAVAEPLFPGVDLRFADADEIMTYELGVKWDFLEGDLTTEFVVFHSDWEDAQTYLGAGPASGISVNAGDVEIQGFEYAINWRTPLEGLTLSANGSFLRGEWTDTFDQLTQNVPTVTEGEDFEQIPDMTYYITADYTTMMGNGLEFFSFASYSFRDSQTDVGNTLANLETDEISIAAMRIGVRKPDSWELAIHGNNLLDEDGVNSVINTLGLAVLRPRELGISFTMSF